MNCGSNIQMEPTRPSSSVIMSLWRAAHLARLGGIDDRTRNDRNGVARLYVLVRRAVANHEARPVSGARGARPLKAHDPEPMAADVANHGSAA